MCYLSKSLRGVEINYSPAEQHLPRNNVHSKASPLLISPLFNLLAQDSLVANLSLMITNTLIIMLIFNHLSADFIVDQSVVMMVKIP